MAIKLFKVDNFSYGIHQEFLIDEKEDLEQIEIDFNCGLGDKAFVPDGTVYVRHSDGFEGELWEEEIAENGGGSSLPDYSEASDGDVLSIEDGEPAWKTPSSGALYVTITALPDPETQELTIITSDKTYAEIDAAMTAGTPVIAKMVSEGFFAPMLAQKMGTTIVFLMIGFAPMGQSSMLMAAAITMASDGTNSMNYTSVVTMNSMGG